MSTIYEASLRSSLPKYSRANGLSGKIITPEIAVPAIRDGSATYIEIENLSYLNFHLITLMRRLRADDRPLIVSGTFDRTIHQDYHSQTQINTLLAAFSSVDYVVGGNFSLKRNPLELASNTSFISNAVSSSTCERIGGNNSGYSERYLEAGVHSHKYILPEDLPREVFLYQERGKEVAVVTGVFDLIHFGHVEYLRQAAETGDVLVVLTNSDASVREQPKARDGTRPVHPLNERVGFLTELEFVDHVVPFDDPTAERIFGELNSIVYVKAHKDRLGEGVRREIIEVDRQGGRTILLPPVTALSSETALSSTDLLKRYKREISQQREGGEFTGYSETAQKIMQKIIVALSQWDKKTGGLARWEETLKRRYEKTVEECEEIEIEVAQEIFGCVDEIQHEIGNVRNYNRYIIPFVIGRLIRLDIHGIPRQRNDAQRTAEMINSVKLVSGKVAFYSHQEQKLYEPIEFDKHYWKPIPQQSNYISIDPENPIGKRIYLFPSDKRRKAISLLILQEEYVNTTDADTRNSLREEAANIAKVMFALFEETDSDEDGGKSSENIYSRRILNPDPLIVAHGGKAILKTAGAALGYAENSRSGIKASLQYPAIDLVEIDVIPCRDGWIVGHDIILDIVTTTTGFTTDKSLTDFSDIFLRLEDGSASSETMPTLEDVLKLVKQYRSNTQGPFIVKIDIKYSEKDKEPLLVETLERSGIPLEKILLTAGISEFSRRVQKLAPNLHLELNTVEPTIFLLAYNLMDDLLANAFVEYVNYYGKGQNISVVSMMQFAMNRWGEKLTKKILDGIHTHGFNTMAWVVDTDEEYSQTARRGITFAMMHNPELIQDTAERRRRFADIRDQIELAIKATLPHAKSVASINEFITSCLDKLPLSIKEKYTDVELREFIRWV